MLVPAGSNALKVFISYSRADMEFADKLVVALESRGIVVLIDRRDLPDLQDWERELLGFIRRADTVVFVVSPNSIQSRACKWEIEQVRIHSKRLAPIVIADVLKLEVPEEISKIQYIFFTDEAQFEAAADKLAKALRTDADWLREHTRLGDLARRWVERGRPDDALIRGQDLKDAEFWVGRKPDEAPAPSEQHREFLTASRLGQEQRTKRERSQSAWLFRASVGAGVFALVAAGAAYAWYQANIIATGTCSVADAYVYPTGKFVKQGVDWLEVKDTHKVTEQYSKFRQFQEDATHIYLSDKNRLSPIGEAGKPKIDDREMWVRIPKCGGQVDWTWSNPLQWTAFQMVSPQK